MSKPEILLNKLFGRSGNLTTRIQRAMGFAEPALD